MRSIQLASTLLLGCVLALPAPAHAQFGGLGKKLGQKVAGKKAEQAIEARTGTVRTGSVSFGDGVVPITEARLDAFLRGLEAETQMAAKMNAQDLQAIEKANETKQKAYDREYDAWSKKNDKWQACSEKEEGAMAKEAEAYTPTESDQARLQAGMEKVAPRIRAAAQRGDHAEVQRLTDSLTSGFAAKNAQAMAAGNAAGPRLLKACGARPVQPERPTLQPTITYEQVSQAGTKASGMDGGEYRIMRERIQPYVLSSGRDSGGYVYTKSEVAALQSRLDALAKWGEALKSY
jgi:hypothetical protein